MRMSGHRTRAVFERHNVVSEDDLKDAVRRLEAGSADLVKKWTEFGPRPRKEKNPAGYLPARPLILRSGGEI
jgi:hypothetical protein